MVPDGTGWNGMKPNETGRDGMNITDSASVSQGLEGEQPGTMLSG